jgi:hypothetical protein
MSNEENEHGSLVTYNFGKRNYGSSSGKSRMVKTTRIGTVMNLSKIFIKSIYETLVL